MKPCIFHRFSNQVCFATKGYRFLKPFFLPGAVILMPEPLVSEFNGEWVKVDWSLISSSSSEWVLEDGEFLGKQEVNKSEAIEKTKNTGKTTEKTVDEFQTFEKTATLKANIILPQRDSQADATTSEYPYWTPTGHPPLGWSKPGDENRPIKQWPKAAPPKLPASHETIC
jgi:hypothetical protein